MKQFFRFAAIVAAIAGVFACQEKEDGPDSSKLDAPVVTVNPAEKFTLSEDAKDADALTISWTAVAEDADYTVNMAPAKAADYSSAWKKATKETSVKFTTEELQQTLIGMGYAQGDNVTLKVMVEAVSGALSSKSADARVQCVLYAHVVTLNAPVVTLTSTEVVLTEANKDNEAVKATWTDASVDDVYVDYVFEWTLAADTEFAAAQKVNLEDALEFSVKTSDLHYALIDLGYKAGETVNLLCRVSAEPAVGSIEPVTSEAVAFSVKLWEKAKNENIATELHIVGNAVSWAWNNKAEEGAFTCLDAENGIFEWQGTINNIDTFQFLLHDGWNIGLTPGEGDYYWSDMKYANPLVGDRDYQRVLIPGVWHFYINTSYVEVIPTLIETSLEYVTVVVYDGETKTQTQIPVVDKTKATFEGTITLPAGRDFLIYTDINDQNRVFSCHPKSEQQATSWRLFETREVDESKLAFMVPDAGEYKLSMDLLNHTMTATAL